MSTFGQYFRVTTYGESHCLSVGVTVDGCPSRLKLTEADIQPQLNRRRPGQSKISTPRDEKDKVEIHSGTEKGLTLGSPIHMRVMNENQRPQDYGNRTMDMFPRPSHADWTYQMKYGVRASSGGGRASARETIARVAAGAIAEKCLHLLHKTEIVAFVDSVGSVKLFPEDSQYQSKSANPEFIKLIESINRDQIDTFITRCPNQAVSKEMEELILKYKEENDSIGGTVTCVIRNCPIGLGEPAFDKLEAKLAHAMLSIPATKGFEIGSGFAGAQIPGSKHNDPWVSKTRGVNGSSGMKEVLGTSTNYSGGIQGGISNGENIYFTVAFKSPATISQAQQTATYDGKDGTLEAKGRHDPCVVPRAVPIVEAMAALTLMDAFLAQTAKRATSDLIVQAQSTEMEI